MGDDEGRRQVLPDHVEVPCPNPLCQGGQVEETVAYREYPSGEAYVEGRGRVITEARTRNCIRCGGYGTVVQALPGKGALADEAR